MVTPHRYVKLEKKKEKQLAIEFGRKRKFVHKAEVKRLAVASYKDNNSLPKKMTTIKAGKSGKFRPCVLYAHFVATTIFPSCESSLPFY